MIGKKQFSHGFANMKRVIAFKTKEERDNFLFDTYDLSAAEISRKNANYHAEKIFGGGYGYGVYGIKFYTEGDTKDYVAFRT